MRKILWNHFGNASQNGLCLSGNYGIAIFDKYFEPHIKKHVF
jgi:hypothetical protein